jgi:phenylalanyl-tRNA synthetase alpha chain
MEDRYITIKSPEEDSLKNELAKKQDAESKRMHRFLNMPDLTRVKGSPIYELANRIINVDSFKDFDVVKVPEIVGTDVSFDLFDFAGDHPARSKSDTYYVDDNNILRPHTTVMWYYWLKESGIKSKIKKEESVGAFSYGKVYRKDEIDRHHMNVFHQMDGWYLCPKIKKIIGTKELQDVLIEIAQSVFGDNIEYRFNKDTFPYTDPSIEMEIKVSGRWVEVLGSGVVKGSVLKKLGVDPDVYNGWAFGFGLERLAIISMDLPDIRLLWSDDERVKKQMHLGQKYEAVSKFPPITRDISFIVDKGFVPNNYFDLIRDIGGDLVEEVELLDKYENDEKFGANKISYTYRIVYRSHEKTLLASEIDPLQDKIYQETKTQFGAELR